MLLMVTGIFVIIGALSWIILNLLNVIPSPNKTEPTEQQSIITQQMSDKSPIYKYKDTNNITCYMTRGLTAISCVKE